MRPKCDDCEKDAAERLEACLFVIRELVNELPTKRDWLNPDLEKYAREIISCGATERNRQEAELNRLRSAPSSLSVAANLARRVASHLDLSGFDTTMLPEGMGDDLRNLRRHLDDHKLGYEENRKNDQSPR